MKYKVKYRLSNIIGNSSDEVVKLQMIVKGLFGTVAATQIVSDNMHTTAIVLILGAVLDVLLGGFEFVKK